MCAESSLIRVQDWFWSISEQPVVIQQKIAIQYVIWIVYENCMVNKSQVIVKYQQICKKSRKGNAWYPPQESCANVICNEILKRVVVAIVARNPHS